MFARAHTIQLAARWATLPQRVGFHPLFRPGSTFHLHSPSITSRCMSDSAGDSSGPVASKEALPGVSDELRLKKIRSSCNKYESRLLSGITSSTNVGSDFSDIHVPRSVIDSLRQVTSLPQIRRDAFKYGLLSQNRVPGALLYGPPGTGKTHLAKSLARDCGHTMLEVSPAHVKDQWLGESEKNAAAIFTLARKLRPCIIFIDEADAIFGSRKDRDDSWDRSLTNQFLQELDGIASADSDASFLLLATNRPFDIDTAVLRRVPLRIHIDLPTCDDRLAILKILLKDETLGLDTNLPTLAESTESYSGSDLKNLCVTAALTCIAEESPDPTTNQYPSRRVLQKKHFDHAMEVIKATPDSSSMFPEMEKH